MATATIKYKVFTTRKNNHKQYTETFCWRSPEKHTLIWLANRAQNIIYCTVGFRGLKARYCGDLFNHTNSEAGMSSFWRNFPHCQHRGSIQSDMKITSKWHISVYRREMIQMLQLVIGYTKYISSVGFGYIRCRSRTHKAIIIINSRYWDDCNIILYSSKFGYYSLG